ncbi:MAG: B12-binding domain-containing radical SAM protein [Chitinophagales bacterium]|nr:B12-binding domain-containing radical SAM protein [Chitinophagales bacterium]
MRITFVAWGAEQLGMTLLANMAKENGHQVNLAFSAALFKDLGVKPLMKFFDDTDLVLEAIRRQNPEVIAFSSLTMSFQWMLLVAREAKKWNPNIKTVFGGVHVSAIKELALQKDEIDYVVVGEGEEAFPLILDAIKNNDYTSIIPNTIYKNLDGEFIKGPQKGYYQDLDTLPGFTKELWENDTIVNDKFITMASRGCPYRCTFCFNNFFAELPDDKKNKGKYVRQRSVEHVINELLIAKEKYKKIDHFDFQDDIFTVDKGWLKEFLKVYKEKINVPFQCLTHPKYMDEDIARWLKEAGCIWVQMGIQTMDNEFKNKTLKRYEKNDHIEESLEYMLEAGLNVKVDHMLGLPDEPISAQEKARQLYAYHCPQRIQVFWTCFLPGTEMLRQGVESGIVSEAQKKRLDEGIDFYFFNNSENIKDMEIVKLYQCYELLFKTYPYLPKFIRIRFDVKHVKWIPYKINKMLCYISDLLNTIMIHKNPDMKAYLHYYWYHSKRIFLLRVKNKFSKKKVIYSGVPQKELS